jgi:hypothetical protein
MVSCGDREALMGSMEAYIHHENLIIFKRRLADPNISDERRRMLTRLLALEQARQVHEKEDGDGDRKHD